MVTFGKLFEASDVATLQSSTISVTDCLSLIKDLRNMYVQFWENVQNDSTKLTDDLMEKNSISNWDVTSTRVRRLSAQLKESVFFM